MDVLVRNLKIIWRTESMITEKRMEIVSRQIGFFALAGLVAAFGLVMLDLAIFFALRDVWGDAQAALAIALGNFLIAILLVFHARQVKAGPELEPVREVRDMAMDELTAEAEQVQAEIRALRDEFKDFEESVRAFVKNPIDALSPTVLMPLVSAALKAFRGK